MRAFLRGLFKVVVAIVIIVALAAGFAVASVELLCQPDSPPAPAAAASLPIDEARYRRNEANTYFTFAEWYIVYSTEDFGRFLDTGSESEFPYWRHIAGFWRSYCAANRIAAGLPGDHGQVKLMINVIGLSYSFEYAIKGAYEATVGRLTEWLRGPVKTAEDVYAKTVLQDYGAFLHTVPWYQYPFFDKLNGLWEAAPFFGSNPPRNVERHLSLSLEYLFKAGYARLIALGLAATSAPEDREIMFVVRGDPAPILAAHPTVKLVRSLPDNMAILIAPRYSAFTDLLKSLSDENVEIVEIAGNRHILMTALLPDGPAPQIEGTRELFSMPLGARPGFRRAGFDLDVTRLSAILQAYKRTGVDVEHLYDY